jgi:LPS sulfotransferase NodH
VNAEVTIRRNLAKRAHRIGAEWLRARQHFQRFPPIFIIGAPRSGTTLLLRVLGNQPPLSPVFEPWTIWQSAFGPWPDDTFAGWLTPVRRIRMVRAYWRAIAPERPVLLVKDPRDSLRVEKLHRLFPSARFIYILRDPRDAICSMIRAIKHPTLYKTDDGWPHVRIPGYKSRVFDADHLKAAHIWSVCVHDAIQSLRGIPQRLWTTVRYERLLEEPVPVVKRLLTFIGVQWPDGRIELVTRAISDQVVCRAQNESAIRLLPSGPPCSIAGLKSIEHLEDAGSGTLSLGRRIGRWREELTREELREVEAVIHDAWSWTTSI